MENLINNIIQGDAWTVLRTISHREEIDMCITSPPYWALRDYGVEGQLGLEPTFESYITKLCDIFDEVKRVLKDEGTCWVVMGDTYFGGCGGTQSWEREERNIEWNEKSERNPHRTDKIEGMQSKCLLQIPSRFAIEMCNRGWILRNTIIWFKPNCMPSSADDRFTVDFEYLYFFSKQKKYYFEQQFETSIDPESFSGRRQRHSLKMLEVDPKHVAMRGFRDMTGKKYPERNKRCVWTITTKSYSEAHFATYPEELIITPIKAGCPEGGVVLDPFMGAGTTAVVARKLNRKYVGIELNKEYIKMAEKRIETEVGNLF